MPDLARMHRLVATALLALLGAAGGLSAIRALRLEFDFGHFFLDARYVWEHGALNPLLDEGPAEARRRLPFYLPGVPALLAPWAGLGLPLAAAAWTVLQVGSLVVCWRRLRCWCAPGPRSAPPTIDATSTAQAAPIPPAHLLAGALALPVIYEALRFNQLSLPVLALVLTATDALLRGRSLRAGAALGAATFLKLLPAVFLLWLALKRRWSALGGALGSLALLAVLPSLAAFGPRATWEYHRQWWQYNVHGAVTGLSDPHLREHFLDHRNQSVFAVVARWTRPDHPFGLPRQPLRLAAPGAQLLAGAVLLGLALTLGLILRRTWERLAADEVRHEVALAALGMLILAPLLRQYYLVWAWPALALLARGATSLPPGAPGHGTGAPRALARVRGATSPASPPGRKADHPGAVAAGSTLASSVAQDRGRTAGNPGPVIVGRLGVLVWIAGMFAWLSEPARAGGAHLLMLLLLMAALTAGRAMAVSAPAPPPRRAIP